MSIKQFLPKIEEEFSSKELYEMYVELGKLLYNKLQPTRDEIVNINEQLVDMGWEDLLCHPDNPESGGDLGLLASYVFDQRQMIEEEKETQL